MGGGVKSPRGINTPGVEDLPLGNETSGVPPEGDRVTEADVQGRGGYGNSPSIQDTKVSGDSSSDNEMASGPVPAAPSIPQKGTATGRGSKGSMHRHPDGANSARPKHGMLACHKYGLLVPEEPAGDPAAAEPQERGDGHDATMGTGFQT